MSALWIRLGVGLLVATMLRVAATSLLPELADLIEPFVVVVIWIAISSRPLPAQLAGMLLGFAFDVFSGRPFGLGGFAGTLVGYLVARFAQHLLVRQPRALAPVFALAITAQQCAIAGLEVLLIPGAVVPGPERVVLRVLVTTALGLLWIRSEAELLERLAGWRRERGSRLRLG